MSLLTQRIFSVLLCLAAKTERLVLCRAQHEDSSLLNRIISLAAAGEYGEGVLPNCSTIFFHDSGTIGLTDTTTDYALVRNLKCLHLRRSIGYISFPPQDLTWASRLRELRLISCVDAKDMFRICKGAVRLRNLSLIMTKPSDIFRPLPPEGEDLNCALLQRANTLKILELRTCQNTWFIGQLGPTRRLDCCPRLTKLKMLIIDIPLLFNLDIEEPSVSFLDRLPPNLVSLSLAELWWRPRSPSSLEARRIKALLEMFALHADSILPSLDELQYIHSRIRTCLSSRQIYEIWERFSPIIPKFTCDKDFLPREYFTPLLTPRRIRCRTI
ncbi:hypothetical protein F5Y04DRAFT_241386 [Hypomontagnella monticulosa]|nr:hypothetical protein F5Y04DRAFT_241386 [Hypomontagnella monticulosa]